MSALLSVAGSLTAAEYSIDIGGPTDELFILNGWYDREGPYQQYGPIWRSACRWASQGAMVRLPVWPGTVNRVELRGQIGAHPDQRLRFSVDGQKAAELPYAEGLQYGFDLPPELIGSKKWVELRLEVTVGGPVAGGDTRDLRVAVDWIKVSADGADRNVVAEAIALTGHDFGKMVRDAAPKEWRFRYDPNNVGDSYAPQQFHGFTYDDSAFEIVPTTFVPSMRRGDAAWYRAWVMIEKRIDAVKAELRLPGEGFEKDGKREVWVNGRKLTAGGVGDDLDKTAAEGLLQGINHIVVKILKGPLPRVTGDDIVEPPKLSGFWNKGIPRCVLKELVLKPPYANTKWLTARLIYPSGRVPTFSTGVSDAGDGRRVARLDPYWDLNEYGLYTLEVEDKAGHRQQFPIHCLGVHLFHWGWYSASGGTAWSGFAPTSNDYIDQLLSRLGDRDRPHHSISWGGAILAPGTGFHRTEKVNYVEKFREAIAKGQLDFVGMPFAPRNICTDFGESLLRGMRRSREIYKSQLSASPHVFYSHDATMTPQLPQIMQLCGYDTYCISENWWGQGRSIPNSRDCYFRNPDGTQVRILDSWYHGIPPSVAARRAVEQGKTAVLCNEEFACLDRTVFLEESELQTLAAEGIFLKPVSLEEYRWLTEEFAREYTYEGDDALCYKGWTGGGEGELEYEKANRLLETKLVALENVAAMARYAGVSVDQKRIDGWWDLSLRNHECHYHWGNGIAEGTRRLREALAQAEAYMRELASAAAERSASKGNTFTYAIVNPLGFKRSGLVEFSDVHAESIFARWAYPLQQDPDRPSVMLAYVHNLPALGYRMCTLSGRNPPAANPLPAGREMKMAIGDIQIQVADHGEFGVSGMMSERMAWANRLYLARAQDRQPDEPLSTASNPLNLKYYAHAVPAGPLRSVAYGPVFSAVEADLKAEDYPDLLITQRVTIVTGEMLVRVRLTLKFAKPTVILPKGAPGPHEGTYIPGMFVAFPFPKKDRPLADMAYCVTDNVLDSTNHETFMRWPFRNGTFNALSLAGPDSGNYAVLTRGLPDFFVLREPENLMGLSLGMGAANCPFNGTYVHEYALYIAPIGDTHRTPSAAYMAAQSYLVEPFAVPAGSKKWSDLPEEGFSFASASGDKVLIPGVEWRDNELLLRVVNLAADPVRTQLTTLLPLDRAGVAPSGTISPRGVMELGPKSIREVRIRMRGTESAPAP